MSEKMELLPCPGCEGTNLTEPFDVNFEYVVCQGCGLRAERESWNMIPRLTARVKELEEVEALAQIISREFGSMDWGLRDTLWDRLAHALNKATLNKEPPK